MHAWPAPEVPDLPGQGSVIRLHDTAAQGLVPTPAAAPGEAARIYVCGITPYDATHMGHAATYLAFDLIQPRVAGRRARRCPTCRTSPTSTTRCSSAPLATGEDWVRAGRAARPRCSART